MTNKLEKKIAGGCIVSLMMFFGMGSALAQDPGIDKLSDPLTGLTAEELADFVDGLEVFERSFGPSDGGGPMRNTLGGNNSCVQCHSSARDPDGGNNLTKDGGGSGFFRANQATAYDAEAGTCDHLGDRGGPGFQSNVGGLSALGLAPLAQDRTDIGFGITAPDEYVPVLSKDEVAVGPVDSRTTNDLFGLGLLDAITDQKLSTLADPDDSNGDGISGRIHWVTDDHGVYAGKFGRKSEVAHLDEFNAEAFQNEQGVTNPEFMDDGVLVTSKSSLLDLHTSSLADGVGDPEVSQEEMDLLNAYVRFLAPPEQNPGAGGISKKDRNQGSRIFRQTGCADCHTPQLTTGASAHAALNHKVIQPYSDLLLHDMGVGPDSLVEGCKGDATPSEWRTEPLWGLRFVPARYMHDGRASTLEEAIAAHAGEGSEASNAVETYEGLKQKDKDLLIDFLNTL